MATPKELRDQAARVVTEARSMLDGIADDATAEVRKEAEIAVDKALDKAGDLEARAERFEKLEAAEQRAKDAAEDAEREIRQAKRPGHEPKVVRNDEEITYRAAFHQMLLSHAEGGFMSPEARSVLAEQRAQTTANTAGGYSIPEEMLERVIVSMKAWGPMYDGDVVTEIVTSGGNPMPMPTVDDTSVTAGSHTEGATLTDDGGKDVTFGTKQLDAYAFDTEWLRVSLELADDSFIAMETFIGRLLGERLARIANLQLTTGTGSSAPNGIVTASGAGITAASATAITSDEIIELEHSVDPAYRTGSSVGFMFNDATLKAIRKLKDGDGNYLWQMGNIQGGIPNTLNGRPYWINQDMPDIATGNKSMIFGDMSAYYVRKVGQPLIGAVGGKDFWPGFGIAGYIRFDGELSDAAAVKALTQA
ncbi:MAG: phage major capsid protein [Pseudomonadota bacterium]